MYVVEIFSRVWYWMWVGTSIDVTNLWFDLRQLLHNIEFESIHYPILSIEVFFSVQHHDDHLMYLLFLKLTKTNRKKNLKCFFMNDVRANGREKKLFEEQEKGYWIKVQKKIKAKFLWPFLLAELLARWSLTHEKLDLDRLFWNRTFVVNIITNMANSIAIKRVLYSIKNGKKIAHCTTC